MRRHGSSTEDQVLASRKGEQPCDHRLEGNRGPVRRETAQQPEFWDLRVTLESLQPVTDDLARKRHDDVSLIKSKACIESVQWRVQKRLTLLFRSISYCEGVTCAEKKAVW